jgi:flagellar biosynthesis/type III secretory pathway chaperone
VVDCKKRKEKLQRNTDILRYASLEKVIKEETRDLPMRSIHNISVKEIQKESKVS